MLKNLQKNEVALVLGGHVNGYSIIKELSEESVNDIALFDYGSSISRFSNKVIYKAQIDKKASSLKNLDFIPCVTR